MERFEWDGGCDGIGMLALATARLPPCLIARAQAAIARAVAVTFREARTDQQLLLAAAEALDRYATGNGPRHEARAAISRWGSHCTDVVRLQLGSAALFGPNGPSNATELLQRSARSNVEHVVEQLAAELERKLPAVRRTALLARAEAERWEERYEATFELLGKAEEAWDRNEYGYEARDRYDDFVRTRDEARSAFLVASRAAEDAQFELETLEGDLQSMRESPIDWFEWNGADRIRDVVPTLIRGALPWPGEATPERYVEVECPLEALRGKVGWVEGEYVFCRSEGRVYRWEDVQQMTVEEKVRWDWALEHANEASPPREGVAREPPTIGCMRTAGAANHTALAVRIPVEPPQPPTPSPEPTVVPSPRRPNKPSFPLPLVNVVSEAPPRADGTRPKFSPPNLSREQQKWVRTQELAERTQANQARRAARRHEGATTFLRPLSPPPKPPPPPTGWMEWVKLILQSIFALGGVALYIYSFAVTFPLVFKVVVLGALAMAVWTGVERIRDRFQRRHFESARPDVPF